MKIDQKHIKIDQICLNFWRLTGPQPDTGTIIISIELKNAVQERTQEYSATFTTIFFFCKSDIELYFQKNQKFTEKNVGRRELLKKCFTMGQSGGGQQMPQNFRTIYSAGNVRRGDVTGTHCGFHFYEYARKMNVGIAFPHCCFTYGKFFGIR